MMALHHNSFRMMINKNSAGLILGSFLGGFHLIWAILVATGVAQPLLDWVLSLHFLNNPYRVGAFDVGTAAMLVIFTFAVGYVAGFCLAFLWEKMHGKK